MKKAKKKKTSIDRKGKQTSESLAFDEFRVWKLFVL